MKKITTKDINEYNHRRKKLMVECFGGKCQICGYDRCLSSLEFHHINPNEKEITLSKSILSWDKTKEELKKCICVCANCHREIHDGIIKIDDTKQYFNDIIADGYDPTHKKTKIYDKCPICGKDKLITRKYCSTKCANKNNHKCIDYKSYGDIVYLIDNNIKSIAEISRDLGVSWTAVKKYYKKLKNMNNT